MRTIFAKYNRDRLPEYQIVTKIVSDENGKKYAVKIPLCNEAKEHIESIYNNYKLLKSSYDINLVKPKKIKNGVMFEMVDGVSLERVLLESMAENDNDKFQKCINKFLDFVDKMVSAKDVSFEPSKEFINVFGVWDINEPQDVIKIANVDLIFSNIFVDAEDNFILIDYEWVFDFEVPKSFIIWRSLYFFYVFHVQKNYDNKYKSFLENFFDPKKYIKNEESFYDYVFGKDKKYSLAPNVCKHARFIDFDNVNTFSSDNFLQLFVDQGNGFSEEDSIRLPVLKNSEIQTFEFDLSNYSSIKNLRLDPLNDCCVLEIKELYLSKKSEDVDLLQYIRSNAHFHNGNTYLFTTEEPSIYFDGLPSESFKQAQALKAVMQFNLTGKNALQLILEQTRSDLEQTRSDLEQTRSDLEQTRCDLEQTKIELTNIHLSKIYKITQAIRNLYVTLRKLKDYILKS